MFVSRWLMLVLVCLAFSELPAVAEDYVPILPGHTPGQGGGNNPGPAGAPMVVPDYIKPGFQFLYFAASFAESREYKKPNKAGMGYIEYTVVKVLKDKVLVNATNYLAPNALPMNNDGTIDTSTDPGLQLTGSSTQAVSKMDIQLGAAMWMTVDRLKGWESGNAIEVGEGLHPYQGKARNIIGLKSKSDDGFESNVFDKENGMKLAFYTGSGGTKKGVEFGKKNMTINDYKNQSQMVLQQTSQIDSPLLGAKWPDWAKTVKKMSYKGTYTMAIAGVDPIPLEISSEVTFTERGDDYVIGSASFNNGSGESKSMAVHGPGTVLGYWVHPEVLANMNQGVVMKNDILHTQLTYQVQDGRLGRLGVFFLTNSSRAFHTVSAYNLQTGALTYTSMHTAETGITVELALQGME